MADARIHLAFRFHTNFVHSYRGDTPDEAGFGQDIRIIRHLVGVLDRANEMGLDVRATWDVDHAFSLEQVMPTHCPDIIEAWQRRVTDGLDEMALMSHNNALLSTHTAAEFDMAIGRAISNDRGSGIRDLFGVTPRVVRPQEMMLTPRHLEMYPRHGIDTVSLYYSAVPFNAFSNFVPPLSLVERFNPLTLSMSGTDSTMTLLPAHNHGDIAEQVSLRGWIRRLRKEQQRLSDPVDLLVLIDADADDEFWVGYELGPMRIPLSAARGLAGLLTSIRDLDYVVFTTPERYLQDHEPVGRVEIGQDTADGSFDGYASWAEKWSSTRLWTGVERSRRLEAQTMALLGADPTPPQIVDLLAGSRDARLRSMSTTNFGLSSPVVLAARLVEAEADVDAAVDLAATALETCVPDAVHQRWSEPAPGTLAEFWLLDHERHVSTEDVGYSAPGSHCLVRIPLTESLDRDVRVIGPDGTAVPATQRTTADGSAELLIAPEIEPYGEHHYQLLSRGRRTPPAPRDAHVVATRERLGNGTIEIQFDADGQAQSLLHLGRAVASGPFVTSAVTYGRRVLEVPRWDVVAHGTSDDGQFGRVSCRGAIEVLPGHHVQVERDFLLVAGLDSVHIDTSVTYPDTTAHRRSRRRGDELGVPHDTNWNEVMPCELRPSMRGVPSLPLRVWKHNALDHVSCYDLDYGRFGPNRELDAVNNHVIDAWLAISNGDHGMLVAQSAVAATNFAFAPLRTRTCPEGSTEVRINPFGTYTGRQLRYPTARSGLGRLAALRFASSCRSPAPSFGGTVLRFSLFIAPYSGDAPPDRLRREAEAFAAPPVLLTDGALFRSQHRDWRASTPG